MAVAVASNPATRQFFPYSFNGGSVVAVAGDDFSVIGSDTRLSEGFMIHTREKPKTYQLTKNTVLGCCGFHGDVLQLTKNIEARLKMYEHEHCKTLSAPGIAQMLSTMLYYKRFFPYYVYNIVAGLDNEGKGCIFSFDPVGSYQREEYRAEGSSASMLQPLLDNQIGKKNMQNVSNAPLTKEEAVQLIKDAFISAAERDINTGDGVVIQLVTKEGVKEEFFPLRRD